MLLLWAALLLLVSANDYIRYRHMDAPEHDLVSVSVSDIDELKQLCNAVKECKGFNSRGILKTNVSFPSYTNTSTDLYVKLKNPAGPNPNIWPFPQQFTQGNLNVTINPATFAFIAQPSFNDIQNAFVWFRSLIFTHPVGTPTVGPFLPSLTVQVSQPYVQLQNGIDESYILDIPSDGSGATLKATTYYGAVNGLQTFSQLVVFDFASHSYQIRLAPWLVQDAPRYPHRGMLIDTSRHFQPVSVLLKVIDSLSFAKFNVLHWHLSDSQSFPFESRTYPNLWAGSYSEQERYTQEDVQEVVEYARQRNVRTMVEFDTPGHAASWCAGYMNVCPSPSCLEPLNPATEDTFNLIESLFGECTGGKTAAGLFPENFFHLGGDEVDTSCWSSTPSIQQWMTANNFTTDDAYYYFINRSMTYAIADGRIPVNWEEVYDHFGKELAPQAVVHAWFDKTTVSAAVADGYHALNSDGWYLDHLDDLWQTYYNNDPMENITVPAQQALVYGGEACMWGETVDPSDIFNTIWPRAAAVAERLWSPANIDDTALALPRYEWFRCFMTRRGINAAPSNNAEARQPPPNPGSCLVQ